MVIGPIFEADFKDYSYGFRPKKNAHQALAQIRKASKTASWVIDVDIQGYFDHINHDKLIQLVEQRISDRRILKLIRQWLKASVMECDQLHDTSLGAPRGKYLPTFGKYLPHLYGHIVGKEVFPPWSAREICR